MERKVQWKKYSLPLSIKSHLQPHTHKEKKIFGLLNAFINVIADPMHVFKLCFYAAICHFLPPSLAYAVVAIENLCKGYMDPQGGHDLKPQTNMAKKSKKHPDFVQDRRLYGYLEVIAHMMYLIKSL